MLVVVIGVIAVSAGCQSSSLYRAFLQREKATGRVAQDAASVGMSVADLERIRWSNESKYLRNAPSIGEIVSAEVSYTQDTHQPVIRMVDVGGHTWSLWVNEKGQVSSITDY